jgi:hypothetical protein
MDDRAAAFAELFSHTVMRHRASRHERTALWCVDPRPQPADHLPNPLGREGSLQNIARDRVDELTSHSRRQQPADERRTRQSGFGSRQIQSKRISRILSSRWSIEGQNDELATVQINI